MAYFAASLNKLGLNHCEEMSQKALSHIMYVYSILHDKHPKVVSTLNGIDVADEILETVKELCPTLHLLMEVNGLEEKRRAGEGEEGKERREDEEEEEKKGDKDEDLNTTTRISHHLDWACMVPKRKGYVGPNLKHHLREVHAKKGQIDTDDVDRLFAMGLDSKKRGLKRIQKSDKSIKGRWKRWCPEPGCEYLGTYLPEHLQNKHRMKPSSTHYRLSLKVAKRYQGLSDELENIVQADSPAPPSSPLTNSQKTHR